jgi:hypothetical protein
MTPTNLAFLKKSLLAILGPYPYEIVRHTIAHRRIPNLITPITFNDRIGHRKLHQVNPLHLLVANKWLVRHFVAERLGSDFLAMLYFAGDDIEAIRFDQLPRSFVMKATHGSGPDFIRFFPDKQRISGQVIKEAANQLLQQKYGNLTNERWYVQMQPQIIIEEMLQDIQYAVPLDYKFFVFAGVAKYIQVDYARFERHTRTIYDVNWNVQEVVYKYPRGPVTPKPALLARMIEAAETLAAGFDFARVDLYCLDDVRIVFGEITLAPEAGWGRFEPKCWDYKLGEMWPDGDNNEKITQALSA